jgi:hypothetical protein
LRCQNVGHFTMRKNIIPDNLSTIKWEQNFYVLYFFGVS